MEKSNRLSKTFKLEPEMEYLNSMQKTKKLKMKNSPLKPKKDFRSKDRKMKTKKVAYKELHKK